MFRQHHHHHILVPASIALDPYNPFNSPHSASSVDPEVMYYQDHSQHVGLPFPQAHQAPLVLADYQHNPLDDTPSSMDDHVSPAIHNENGKRVSYSTPAGPSRKRVRKESDLDGDGSAGANSPQDVFDPKEGKPKATRGARKHEQLTKSLRKMERTLDTVLRSISNPALTSLAGGMVSQSPSPPPDGGSSAPDVAASPDRPDFHQDGGMQPIPNPATYGAAVAPVGGSPRLHSLPDNVLNPLGLLAEASSSLRRGKPGSANSPASAGPQKGQMSASALDNPKVGVANLGVYFKPGPMTILPLRQLIIEHQVQPEMLSFVSPDVVVELFRIYFEHMNPHNSLLDVNFHTPALICARSPFLLTTICAISSKFYTADEELHPKLTKLVNKLAWSVPERGYKSVEIVQAYLLLSLWGSPVERYEHDRTWMLLGMAIRMATDLNLHRKNTRIKTDTPEGRAREVEIRNRERTWLLCFVLDRSFSAQMGKPNVIKEDYIIRDASQWCRQPDALPQDVGLVAYVELQRVVSRGLDLLYSGTATLSGLQTTCDYLQIIRAIESQIEALHNQWYPSIQKADTHTAYRLGIARFYWHYATLVLNSFGLQNALERSSVDIGYFFGRCYTSATACCYIMKDELAPAGFLRYCTDSHFVLTSYAVLSLLKLVRPEFRSYMDNESKILTLVGEMADTLQTVAVNKYHTPYLYSVFLRALLASKVEGSQPNSPRPMATPGPVISANDPAMQTSGMHFAPGPESPTRNGFSNSGDLFGLDMYRSLGENYGDTSNFVNPFDMSTAQPMNMDISSAYNASVPAPSADPYAPMSLDSLLSSGFWDSMLVPGFSNTLEGMSGGFIYGPGGSGFISRWHSPASSRRQTPKADNRSLPGMTPLEVS
ncbi:SubName: Full=Uncharacterized protein {ECO:0000313/EMBL:CCA78067.1} [Serendipita indica DSM 11827]|uniref:Xylanolytic transcriptional activator regulatory domain-containing protein n=1 Tax=Serendipita indica (strain DSM 11827) TaxID=1109443 RepID=G4U3A0_SERID|nr:SubName: Full=Uncharacterized protein {ECO:0000313/EMBL:CCA78067.1} [Serendipita indica DSM 11827]CCA78067.1 hypothetical protein PIIN_01742 [Serendipita indica DSM 11827]